MKTQTTWRTITIAALALAALTPAVSRAAITGPYTADVNTLHLFHLDESAAPMLDTGSAATLRDLAVVSSTPGAAGLSGFGTALSYTANGQEARNSVNTSQTEWQGASGSFTLEALINVSTALTGINATQTILARDHTSGGPNTRSFILRLNGANIDFINTGAAGNQTISFALPTLGADAFSLNSWFHIAVAYNGTQNTAGNLSLFWTKVDPSVTTANPLGSGNLLLDVGDVGGITLFTVGNRDGQLGNNSNFRGLIDEVRVSDIARTADQFIFGVPEPTTAALAGIGLLAVIGRMRRRA